MPRPSAAWLLLLGLAAAPARAQEASAPPASLDGWSELDLRLELEGAAVVVDEHRFCDLPCRMLLAPGEHHVVLTAPEMRPRSFTRDFPEGQSLLIEGDLEGGLDGWGIALYAVGGALLAVAMSLVAWDVARNVGYADDDWTASYAACGLAPVGLALALWGAIREGPHEPDLRARFVPL
jgi:hypothetical protein